MADDFENRYSSLADPGIRDFLIAGDRFYPQNAVDLSFAEQRALYNNYCAHFRKPRPQSVTIEDFEVAGVRCRAYQTNGTARPPLLLYLHGGGFVVGGLESHDDICAELCDGADVEVVAVDYRLAPEHPFPAAFDDCWNVLHELAGRRLGMVIAGDSAGGNLAAALCLRARDEGGPAINGQILIYPGLGGDMSSGSYIEHAHAPGLSTRDVIFYRSVYGGPGNKYAEPLRETDYSKLPPAFLVAAGIDPLHDDSLAYASRLSHAGVPSFVRDEPHLVHAFLRARHMSKPAADSFRAITDAVFSLAYHGTLPEQETEPC
jgi:acetyl esterase